MSIDILPVVAPAQTGVVELHHYVCQWDCDDNLALCGTDVSDEPWADTGDECVVCAELDKLPNCASPKCPGRSV